MTDNLWPEEDEFTKEIDMLAAAGELREFTVKDAYFRLVKYPEQCPGCTRTGRDHDGECPLAYPEPDTIEVHVHARLADAKRTKVWRMVHAANIEAGIKIVRAMDDVETVLEGSLVPGGVVT